MGIKFLKLLGWELTFAQSVKMIREKELKLLKKDAIYVALNSEPRSIDFRIVAINVINL